MSLIESNPGRLAPALLCLALLATAAQAETLCGTVSDRVTGAPVEAVGVLVHTVENVYTGWHAATDADGVFCIDGVVPGVYNLEIRRDDQVLFQWAGNVSQVAERNLIRPGTVQLETAYYTNSRFTDLRLRMLSGTAAPLFPSVSESDPDNTPEKPKEP